MQIFDEIKIEFDPAELASRILLSSDMPEYLEFKNLLEAITPHVKPTALLGETAVLARTSRGVSSSCGDFNCPLLSELCIGSEKLFPFIVSCGKSLDEFTGDISDPLQLYWLDFLKEHVMEAAFRKIKAEIKPKHPDREITSLIPMDDDIWTLNGLKEVFRAFPAEAVEQIGVELTEYMFMKPNKTRAGVFFETDRELDLCALCKVKKCNGCPVKLYGH